jgi:hypothetical protein
MAPPGFTSSKKAGPPAPPGKSATDIGRELDREITRREYFDSRKDVSDDRLDRRLKQAQELAKFKREETKPVYTTSGSIVKGLTQRRTPASMDLAQKQIELANKYGPTLSEIGSDIGYAFGSMAKGAGDLIMSGNIGILGAIKGIANYALDKANKGYDKLNDVQKYVFDNADRFTFASKVPQVDEVSKAKELALQADRDALGLELDALIAQREEDRFRYENPTVDMRAPTKEDLEALDTTNVGYVESGQFKQDLQNSGILSVDDPSTGEPLPDNTKIPGQESTIGDFKQALENQGFNELQIKSAVNEITRQILSGTYTGDFDVETGSTTVEPEEVKEKSEISVLGAFNPFDDIPTGMAINELINPEQQNLEQFKKEMDQGFIDDQASLSPVDGTQVTAYNNPGNLQFAGQQGAIEGQTYGNNFAVFPDAETGLNALRADLTAKVNRDNRVDEIIGQYAPKEDNPQSFNNYLSFVKDRVGETVEPNEIDDLTRSVIQFENKPDIANQYLTMVADGGMIDKQLKSLQNGLQNMYNGIPSVKRR